MESGREGGRERGREGGIGSVLVYIAETVCSCISQRQCVCVYYRASVFVCVAEGQFPVLKSGAVISLVCAGKVKTGRCPSAEKPFRFLALPPCLRSVVHSDRDGRGAPVFTSALRAGDRFVK